MPSTCLSFFISLCHYDWLFFLSLHLYLFLLFPCVSLFIVGVGLGLLVGLWHALLYMEKNLISPNTVKSQDYGASPLTLTPSSHRLVLLETLLARHSLTFHTFFCRVLMKRTSWKKKEGKNKAGEKLSVVHVKMSSFEHLLGQFYRLLTKHNTVFIWVKLNKLVDNTLKSCVMLMCLFS